MNLKIEEIAEWLHAKSHIALPQATVKTLLTDSRNVLVPESSLFFALKSESNNGHKYINELYRRGVRNFVITETSDNLRDMIEHSQANFLLVRSSVEALQTLGAELRKRFMSPVLAVAGSNGKTIVKEWIWQLLRDDMKISRSPGSYNSQVGVPLSLSMLEGDSRLAIIEAGISKPGEMARLQSVIQPDWGLFTNIGPAHEENFTGTEEKLREKFSLFTSCRALVYCADQPMLDQQVEALVADSHSQLTDGHIYAWSTQDPSARVYFRLQPHRDSTSVSTLWHEKPVTLLIPFTDEASVQNALHCITFIYMLETETSYQMPVERLMERLSQLEPVAMRLEVKEGRNGCVLINDTYNSDLQALELTLDFQSRRSSADHLSRTLILSDIYQSGKSPAELYKKVASLVKQKEITRFIGVGKDLSSQSGLFPVNARFFQTTEDFLSSPLADTLYNELILIKGSRKFGFERISERLALKSHQTVMEVNLDAIVHNFKYFRSLLKPSTRLVAMVKAEAYGLGAVEVAKTLQSHACDALAVAVADEGVRLRQAGISIPILVMNPEPSVFPICQEYNLEPEVYSFKLLEAFLSAGERLGVSNFPIHLKLDTGMHRLGFVENDLPRLLDILRSQNVLRVNSVFSHLAGSDEDTFDDYTKLQWQRYDDMSTRICEALPYKVIRHILNSAGIERFPQWQCDQVRLGIGLYGISVAHPEAVRQVATLKTNILQIHSYQAGDTIGYSRTTVLTRDSRIAVLPIGYADGFNRHNRDQCVLVNGKRAPLMGNICMDVCMIDVTDVPAEEGDEVLVFGPGLSISEVAARLQTIPYEVLTSVSNRVKRVYYQE